MMQQLQQDMKEMKNALNEKDNIIANLTTELKASKMQPEKIQTETKQPEQQSKFLTPFVFGDPKQSSFAPFVFGDPKQSPFAPSTTKSSTPSSSNTTKASTTQQNPAPPEQPSNPTPAPAPPATYIPKPGPSPGAVPMGPPGPTMAPAQNTYYQPTPNPGMPPMYSNHAPYMPLFAMGTNPPTGPSSAPQMGPGPIPMHMHPNPANMVPPANVPFHQQQAGTNAQPQVIYVYPPNVNTTSSHSDTKSLMSAFKSLIKLGSTKASQFTTWKIAVATQLKTNSLWSQLVVNTNPPEFIASPVPPSLEDTNNALFAALVSTMDEDTKDLISENISGGIELLESLTKALSPTLTAATIVKYKAEVENPFRRVGESPKNYYLRLRDKMRILGNNQVSVKIDTLAFVLGLHNTKHLLQDGKPAFASEIKNISEYKQWPITWDDNKSDLLNLALQINREYENLKFKYDANSKEYKRINKVTTTTSFAHKNDMKKELAEKKQAFFSTPWAKNLIKNTDNNLCIFHGTNHPNYKCGFLKPFLPPELLNPTTPAPSPTPAPASSKTADSVPAPASNYSSIKEVKPYLSSNSVDNNTTIRALSTSLSSSDTALTPPKLDVKPINKLLHDIVNFNNNLLQKSSPTKTIPTSCPSPTTSNKTTLSQQQKDSNSSTSPKSPTSTKSSLPNKSTVAKAKHINKLMHYAQRVQTPPSSVIWCRYGKVKQSPTKNNALQQLINNSTNKIIIDSGATHHMFNDLSYFTDIFEWKPTSKNQKYVHLADDTKLKIEGIGHIDMTIEGKRIRIPDVLYIPALHSSLFSVRQHIAYQGCAVLAFNNSVTITFGDFIHRANVEETINFEATKTIDFRPEVPIVFDGFTSTLADAWVSPSKHRQINQEITLISQHASNTMFATNPENQITITVVKDHKDAKLPTQQTSGSVGFDISSVEDITIKPKSKSSVSTGLIFNLPSSTYAEIKARSGLAKKHNVNVHNGIIDTDFRGVVHILVYNHSNKPFQIRSGDRIAQMIFSTIHTPTLHVTNSVTNTQRGENGFGSTGISTNIRNYTITPAKEEKWCETIFQCLQKLQSASKTIQALEAQVIQRVPLILPTNLARKINQTEKDSPFDEEDIYEELKDITTENDLITNDHPDKDAISFHLPHSFKPAENSLPRPIRPVDRASSTSRKLVHFSAGQLYQSFAYRNIDHILKHLPSVSKNTINISKDPDASLGHVGQYATVHRGKSNKHMHKRDELFGDTIHIDIGYGSDQGINGVKYCLFIVDRATTSKYTYPLKNLEGSSIAEQLKEWMIELSIIPKQIRADCDPKLLYGNMKKFLIHHGIKISAAPNGRQSQNGLVERNWYTCVRMARSWLMANNLPAKFWFFALKRATEVCNYFPIVHKNKITTPFELIHQEKPDFRTLFPMFSTAYVRKIIQQGGKQTKFTSQTIKYIAVGRANNADALTFYDPRTKDIITSSDFRLDPTKPSGVEFSFKPEHPVQFYRHNPNSTINFSPEFDLGTIVQIDKPENEYHGKEGHIIAVPLHPDDPYTVQLTFDNTIIQYQPENIKEIPKVTPDSTIPNAPSWIHHNAPCTLYLPHMPKAKQGHIIQQDGLWKFLPGRKLTSKQKPQDLPQFEEYINQWITDRFIQKGFHKQAFMQSQRDLYSNKNILALHVSATGLINKNSPSSLKQHQNLHPTDKQIWDDAYREEYQGLLDLGAFEYINEEDYIQMKGVLGQHLPSIAISTIKHDQDGQPLRAKYRIVALGNLDHHDWHTSDVFAPVLNQMEMRLLVAEAAKIGRIPKSLDFQQAFCQSLLPVMEKYVLTPPAGCPITPPKTYLLLKKTLYGLKRSPKHWYDKCVSILAAVGLKPLPHSPCMFIGHPIEGKPPLLLGLYVDDCIYFSASDEVEKKFEETLSAQVQDKVTFMGNISHFLGIKFTHSFDKNNQLSIFLSQQAFIETIAEVFKINPTIPVHTPYKSGLPVDKINDGNPPYHIKDIQIMRRMIGSLLWVSQATRPDVSTITNLLASYQTKPTKSHLSAAKRVIQYLLTTKSLGISFHQSSESKIQTFLNFPIDTSNLTAMADANWGPQDQSKPHPTVIQKLPLFKTRSLSGYITFHANGPISWSSKRQAITARSTAEAEIYATDEAVKNIINIQHLRYDLGYPDAYDKINILNDNRACIIWSDKMTTKGLRHIQIRENAVREYVQQNRVKIMHIDGKINPADIFTKEDKDAIHFKTITEIILTDPLLINQKCIRIRKNISEGGVNT